MKKTILILVLIGAIVLFSGCLQQKAVCGDNSCVQGENATNCPADCSPADTPPMPGNPTDNSENPPELPF